MLERDYQPRLILRLRRLFPRCVILKNDSAYMQGVPDLIILYQDMWAMLETKANGNASFQPNQKYYIEILNGMSFAAVVHPSNEEEVLSELQQAFESRRKARIS